MDTGSNTDSKKRLKQVKTPGSLLNQKVELNYKVEVLDHIYSKIQSQKSDNLPKCQCDSQKFYVGQVQMGVVKLNLGLQNNLSPGSNR